ncbi:MAG TPA: DUF5916 domain-containing protein [Gammaproteobacteria bacterium]|nr:DUF5916 domain-containing protein [Gammaproteobacteria bacterium]
MDSLCKPLLPAFLALLTCAGNVRAANTGVTPRVTAGVRNGVLSLDGKLDEPDWQNAPVLTLTQQNPHPGAATPYLTTVRILRGIRHLYFGITCTDPHPDDVAIHTLQRDAEQDDDDNVMIVLDTFGQKKLAYVFQVNAGGALADGLISPGDDDVDFSWNGYWEATVTRSANGWVAEIRIDTQSLQFNNHSAVWGLNLGRYVPREQLTLAWSGISLDASPTNLQWEGSLSGIQGLSQGSGLEFDPYAVTDYDSTKHGTASWTGFDLKYNFTPELAGRFTYHTDFSEAQANSQQISASPYARTIPETRAFFLEGANIFAFSHNLGQNFIPFYSRSIGLINGATVPLDEGVKLLGHAGGWTLGVLDAQMAGTGVSDATNLFAGRASYNLNGQWRMGALVTHGDPLGASDNTLTSFDSTWSTSTFNGNKNLNISGWVARSWDDTLSGGTPNGYGFDVEYPNDLWYADLNYNFYGNALNPGLGFIQRPGTKQGYAELSWRPRPGADIGFSWVRQFMFDVNWSYVTDLENRVQSNDFVFMPIHVITQGGWNFSANTGLNYEVLASDYSVMPGVTFPAGAYHFTTNHLELSSPESSPFVFSMSGEFGNLYNGHYHDAVPQVAWSAPGGHFTSSLASGAIWFYTPGGNGILRFSQMSLGYSFTPDLTLSTLTQYNNLSHNTSENAILQWNIQPDRVFYLVWSHGLTLNPNLLQGQQVITGDTVVAKLVWGFY